MSVLQDHVPPEDFESVILPILYQELGTVDETFAWIDPTPIGSASIGQVHRAILVDQTPVVVKVCYPHVERLLRGDVRTIRAFCEVAQPVHVPGIKQVEKQFPSEFDYRTEAKNLETVRQNLLRAGFENCRVPEPYPKYCTKHVLVMEELHGEKLVDALKRDVNRWAMATGRSIEDFLGQAKSQSQSSSEMERYIAAFDAKRRTYNIWARLYNSTIAWFTGTRREYQSKVDLPLNHAQIVDDLLYIHGHEVLVDGVYNADCHPGTYCHCHRFQSYIGIRLDLCLPKKN